MDAAATRTAQRRSLDADMASDAASGDSTQDVHRHAAKLHREASEWWEQAGDRRLAEHHETWAKVHAQLAARLSDDG